MPKGHEAPPDVGLIQSTYAGISDGEDTGIMAPPELTVADYAIIDRAIMRRRSRIRAGIALHDVRQPYATELAVAALSSDPVTTPVQPDESSAATDGPC